MAAGVSKCALPDAGENYSNANPRAFSWGLKRVVITGATGWLAHEIAHQIRILMPGIAVIGVSRQGGANGECDITMQNSRFVEDFHHKKGDVLVHCAFCRENNGFELAESLEWTRIVFGKAINEGASGIINVSSQSVYSSGAASNTEETPVSPSYLYAMAKAASETLMRGMVQAGGYSGGATSLRIASLVGVSGGRCPDNILRKFIERAMSGLPITVIGGRQRFSFISIHDAALAVIKALSLNPQCWHAEYNIGPNEQIEIVDMAQHVIGRVKEKCNIAECQIMLKESDIELDSGMVTRLAHTELRWSERYSFVDIIDETIAFLQMK